MKSSLRFFGVCVLVLSSSLLSAQNIDFSKESSLGNLYIRLYGEVHYYQPVSSSQMQQGQFDAKRIVTLFGYQFNRNTQFLTEIEFEHANEVFLEQAFIKHRIGGHTTIKAGMILIPMGIINEAHEPNNYFSVDRPLVDRNLVPTTWRDIGAGVVGVMPSYDLRYQAFLVNGLIGFKDGSAKFNGSKPYRSGRQKGSKTVFSGLPALSGQLEYFGFDGGKVGLSIYAGESNTDMRDGISRDDSELLAEADSTTVHTTMLGLHGKFTPGEWDIKTQLIYSMNSGVEEYNTKTGTDLGESSLGFYAEAGRPFSKNKKWIAFGRYSYLDTVLEDRSGDGNEGQLHVFTTGLNYMAAQGAVFKLDGQWTHQSSETDFQINAGIGVWF